jgi:hypothetical protein
MTFLRPLFLILGLSFLNNISFSQEPTRCGTDEILEQQLLDPKFERSFNTVMDVLSSQSQRASSNETLTIPVVVHVFHDGDDYGTGSNISDEVIYDAIANLNACFAGEPWHTTTHSGVTHPYSDSNIEFCLASIDPDGNPTNGITRQNPDTIVGYTQNGMTTTSLLAETHEHNLKELCYWPIQDYCNIYVLHKLNGGYSPLGFAYLPPNSSYYDGIVCQYQVFGFGEPWLLTNFNKNGTLVHEMGHYLGLFHTFHNTSSCNPTNIVTGEPSNCISQGDALCDTPPTTGSAGCSPLGCPDTMVENFMDYSSDYCMDRFSPDGANRMRSKLLQWRAGLVHEDNLACGIPGGLDVKISNIIVPNVGCDPIMSNANYEIRNLGSDTLTETTINYYVNDQTGTLIWTGNLGFGEAEIVTIPDFNVGFGPVNITVESVPIGDINNENDVATFEYDNYEGNYVDIIVEWDALPYGVDIELFEADSSNNPIGEVIFLYENEDNNLSCTVDTFDFCLSEGNYIVEVNDLFGNGFKYPCPSEFVDRCIWVEINGEMVGDPLCGEWNNGDIIPFTVGPPSCIPTTCYGDADGNGFVWASDILIMLQYFGLEVEPCNPLDTDQDGIVGVNDILYVIANFDSSCDGQLMPEGEFEMFLKKEKDGELLRTTLYNVMGQEVKDFDYIDTGIYIIVQEWMVPDVGVFKTNTKIFKE